MLADPEHVADPAGLDHDDLRLRSEPVTAEHGDLLLRAAPPPLRAARELALQEPQQAQHRREGDADAQRQEQIVQGQASTFSRMRVIRTA